MVPDSMLESNPTMGQRSKELAEKNICRICLIHTDRLLDKQWNTVLNTCFTAVADKAERLPKYACADCSGFLQKCHDFKQMYKKSELILNCYPLTGSLPNSYNVPGWLRQKCKQQETASIRVRSNELLPVNSTLQSPTITSEIGAASPAKVPKIQLSPDNTPTQLMLQQSPNPDRSTVIQEIQSYVDTYQHIFQDPQAYQYQSSPVLTTSTQPIKRYPVLERQLQQPLGPINHQNRNSTANQNQQIQQIVTQQTPMQQLPQQPSQQPVATSKPRKPPRQRTTPGQPPQQLAPSYNPPPSTIPVFQCTDCCYMFTNQVHLMTHMRKHRYYGEYRCACGRNFRHMYEFVNHLKQHTTISWCDLCGEQFAPHQQLELGAHLDRHVQVGLSEACDFCLLVFVDLQSRLQHVRSCHDAEVRQVMQLNEGRGDGGMWVQ